MYADTALEYNLVFMLRLSPRTLSSLTLRPVRGMYKKESIFLGNGWDCVPKPSPVCNKSLEFYEIDKN